MCVCEIERESAYIYASECVKLFKIENYQVILIIYGVNNKKAFRNLGQ